MGMGWYLWRRGRGLLFFLYFTVAVMFSTEMSEMKTQKKSELEAQQRSSSSGIVHPADRFSPLRHDPTCRFNTISDSYWFHRRNNIESVFFVLVLVLVLVLVFVFCFLFFWFVCCMKKCTLPVRREREEEEEREEEMTLNERRSIGLNILRLHTVS